MHAETSVTSGQSKGLFTFEREFDLMRWRGGLHGKFRILLMEGADNE